MSRNRIYATALLVGVMVLAIAIIVIVEIVNVTATTDVYVVTQNVQAGTAYAPGNTQLRQLHGASSGEFNFAPPPQGSTAVFAHAMHVGDVVETDDIEAQTDSSQVAISIKQSPALTTGSNINIYAVVLSGTAQGGGAYIIGHNILVVNGSGGGGEITILVPRNQEALWLSVSTDATDYSLYATLSPGGSVPPNTGTAPTAALANLATAYGNTIPGSP